MKANKPIAAALAAFLPLTLAMPAGAGQIDAALESSQQGYQDQDTMLVPIPTQLSSATTGRNSPCPCNSGKRYKQCCGRL